MESISLTDTIEKQNLGFNSSLVETSIVTIIPRSQVLLFTLADSRVDVRSVFTYNPENKSANFLNDRENEYYAGIRTDKRFLYAPRKDDTQHRKFKH